MPTKGRVNTLEPEKMRELAAWYRRFAGSSVIWESSLLMADALEKEADLLEQDHARNNEPDYPRAN
jgi:hypothetical protein